MRWLILQVLWLGFLVSIDSLKESVKKEIILSLFGLIKLFPDTLVERFSRLILTGLRSRGTGLKADKYELKINAIAEKIRRLEERK